MSHHSRTFLFLSDVTCMLFEKKNFLSNNKSKTIIYNYSLLLPVYILIPKCKVSVQSYSDHAVSVHIQQSDIQVLQQRSE